MTHQRGGMMVEILLTLALCTVMLPFIVGFQRDRATRAQNIATAAQMGEIRTALERYIDANKKQMLRVVGQNITRVSISDLVQFGAPENIAQKYGDDIQVRVLKSNDRDGRATLQGVVVLNNPDITPMRTREIVNLGGTNFGFIDRGQAFGAFGAWRTNAANFAISNADGIVQVTDEKYERAEYLRRVPSISQRDATMLSPMNLGGHNIVNTKFFDAIDVRFDGMIKSAKLVADKMIFQTRTSLDGVYSISDATVTGGLESDSRDLEISDTLTLTGAAKLSNLYANNLWATNLDLGGISISSDTPAMLKVGGAIDMAGGRLQTLYASVGFTGSVTKKLVIFDRIEDGVNANYFWDVGAKTAFFHDAMFAELSRMAQMAIRNEGGNTIATRTFGAVVANKNATAADFILAIDEIESAVSAKYRNLNLE